jgi:hypothetical protein
VKTVFPTVQIGDPQAVSGKNETEFKICVTRVRTYSWDPLRLVRLSSSTTSPGADPEDPSGDKGEADVSKAATETVS